MMNAQKLRRSVADHQESDALVEDRAALTEAKPLPVISS